MAPRDQHLPMATVIDESIPTSPPATSPPATSPPSTVDSGGAIAQPHKRRGSRSQSTHRVARWLHVYTSMIALLIVLFFAITGITLNHPDWVFGDEQSQTVESGVLPFPATTDDGSIDWLPIAEFLRSAHGVKGTVDSFSGTGSGDLAGGIIVFTNPGYSATVDFETVSGEYDLTVTEQGFVAVMNDLHKGRDTGRGWRWVIDIAAGFLVVISLTGLAMQFFLRKRRRSALTSAVLGGVIVVALIAVTIS